MPICMDDVTAVGKRLSYARILVYVTVEEIGKKEILLIGPDDKHYKQKIQVEWSPWACKYCKEFGIVLPSVGNMLNRNRLFHMDRESRKYGDLAFCAW